MHEHHSTEKPVFSVLVCSTTRTRTSDTSGRLIRDILGSYGFKVASYGVVSDNRKKIVARLFELLNEANVVIISGGTGISLRDVTIEAVRSIADREVTGFGIQFQTLSMQEVGSSTMLSSASAFLIGRKLVFCLPGSPEAVRLALDKLIVPEAGHIMHELNR